MRDIINWLLDMESLAAKVYKSASERLDADVDNDLREFIEHLSKEEKEHHDIILKAMGLTDNNADTLAVVTLSEERKKEIENSFRAFEKRVIAGDFTAENLIDCVVTTEFSEWNDIFLYTINTLKHKHREFVPVAARIHHHKRKIEDFLSNHPKFKGYISKIRELPLIWEENLLVVDDDESIRDALGAIVEKEGNIEKAGDGVEALEKVNSRYYAAIITDVDMPGMGGIEFYRKATEKYPTLKGRFLFFTGASGPERISFFEKEGVRYLLKPATIKDLRRAVGEILRG